jgi:aryl-alcohol dehydrogenase-like predicted oxidoreductase
MSITNSYRKRSWTANTVRAESGGMTTSPLLSRCLGDLTVPAIGYGAMVLSPAVYGEINDERALAALRHALDAGATIVDTSDAYGINGHNETAHRPRDRRRLGDLLVATKFGLNVPEGAEQHRFPVGYAFGELAVNGVGIVAWSPLGGGFLTGTVSTLGENDFRHNAPPLQSDNLGRVARQIGRPVGRLRQRERAFLPARQRRAGKRCIHNPAIQVVDPKGSRR